MVKWLMITWIFVLIFSNVVQASNRLSVGFEPPKYVTITGDVIKLGSSTLFRSYFMLIFFLKNMDLTTIFHAHRCIRHESSSNISVILFKQVATMIVIQLAVIVTLRDSHRCAPIAAKKRCLLLQSKITIMD
ncbi:hypothetical protein GOBAR_DD04174 [Gossypium barbadense]|nr:hypothetical protein GOBAR_DD04174 [Gossypium barbadense]